MNHELRKMIVEALAFGNVLDESNLGVSRFGREEKTSRFIRLDMVKFLLYLSVSDDIISDEEAQFFKDYLGYNFQSAQIESLVEKFELKEDTFQQTVPFSFGVLLEADRQIIMQSGKNPGAALALLRVYYALGSAFVTCDDSVAEEERNDFTAYLKMLQETIETSYKEAEESFAAQKND